MYANAGAGAEWRRKGSSSDIAAITSKLDVIMEQPQTLEMLDQLAVKMANFTRSLVYIYIYILPRNDD